MTKPLMETIQDYRYRGMPLTSGIIVKLIPEMYDEDVVMVRSRIIQDVVEYHDTRGGSHSGTKSVTSMVKKALIDLIKIGLAERVAVGYYRILTKDVGSSCTDDPSDFIPVEIGSGLQTVYGYFFPAYYHQAKYLGSNNWPMKIGRTAGEVRYRILDQTTSMPEEPIMAFCLRCDDSVLTERIIHDTLKSRGRYMKGSPGKEWFMTNPGELEEMAQLIL